MSGCVIPCVLVKRHAYMRTPTTRTQGIMLNLVKNPVATAVSFTVNDNVKEVRLRCRDVL